MGIEFAYASPALRAAYLSHAVGEVDGATAPRVRVIGSARCVKALRSDPITLTLVAARLDLSRSGGRGLESREAGEVL